MKGIDIYRAVLGSFTTATFCLVAWICSQIVDVRERVVKLEMQVQQMKQKP